MSNRGKAILILEKKLGKAYNHIAVEDLEKLLRTELDKPAEDVDTVLIHALLDILEPTDTLIDDEEDLQAGDVVERRVLGEVASFKPFAEGFDYRVVLGDVNGREGFPDVGLDHGCASLIWPEAFHQDHLDIASSENRTCKRNDYLLQSSLQESHSCTALVG